MRRRHHDRRQQDSSYPGEADAGTVAPFGPQPPQSPQLPQLPRARGFGLRVVRQAAPSAAAPPAAIPRPAPQTGPQTAPDISAPGTAPETVSRPETVLGNGGQAVPRTGPLTVPETRPQPAPRAGTESVPGTTTGADTVSGTGTGAEAPDGDVTLEVRGLRVEFAGAARTPAVDGLDLTVRRGEIVALVGESGSGKSMTARAVMGLLPSGAQVSAGSILLDGEDLVGLSERRMDRVRGNRVAMLFQQPRAMLDPTATVRDQVAEPLWLHRGLSRRQARERVTGLLRDVGIPEPERRAGAYAHQLSGGMAQRVMIAAALSGEPDVLIADEPTTALDVTVQAQILQLLKRKQRESGLSVLIITHDLGIVASIADRVAVMYAGRIVEDAATKDLFADPQHPYTQALLKASLLSSERGSLYSIPGSASQSREMERGCRFRPRCTVAEGMGIAKSCESVEPMLHSCGSGHRSRCWVPLQKAASA